MPWITKKKSGWILAGIILFALLLRLFYYNGWGGSDDSIYYNLAGYIAHAEPIQEAHWYLSRIVLIVVISLFIKIFGDSVFVAILPTLLFSLANIIMVFFLARYLFSWREGLIAAGIMAIFPTDVIYSTIIMPDIQCAFFLIGAVLLFQKGIDQGLERRSITWFMLSGLLITMAVFSKQTGVLIFPALFLYVFLSLRMSRSGLIALGITSLSFVIWSASIFLIANSFFGNVVHDSYLQSSVFSYNFTYSDIIRTMGFYFIDYMKIRKL